MECYKNNTSLGKDRNQLCSWHVVFVIRIFSEGKFWSPYYARKKNEAGYSVRNKSFSRFWNDENSLCWIKITNCAVIFHFNFSPSLFQKFSSYLTFLLSTKTTTKKLTEKIQSVFKLKPKCQRQVSKFPFWCQLSSFFYHSQPFNKVHFRDTCNIKISFRALLNMLSEH